MNDTQRISAEELQELHKMLEDGGGPELTVEVTSQILARLDAILIQLQEEGEMSYQDVVQKVFVRGLEAYESEL